MQSGGTRGDAGAWWCPAGAVPVGRPAGRCGWWALAGGKPPVGRGLVALGCLWSCSCVVLGTAEQCPCLWLAPCVPAELPGGAVPGGHPLGRSGVYESAPAPLRSTSMLVSACLWAHWGQPHPAEHCPASQPAGARVPSPSQAGAGPAEAARPAAGGKAERGAIKGSAPRRLVPSRLAPGPVFGLLKACLQLVSSR